MDAKGHGFRNAQRAVDTTAGLRVAEHDDARLLGEEATDEVVAHAPELAELLDRIVPFERRVLGRHRYSSSECPLSSAGVRQIESKTRRLLVGK